VTEAAESEGTRYKIGEVCKLADVQPYVLKYWETEFPLLAPEKGAVGPRTYSEHDLRVIERIKKLLYDEGYTIAGAKKRLDVELRKGELPPSPDDSSEPDDANAESLVLTPAEAEPSAPRPRRSRSGRPAPAAPVPEPEDSVEVFETHPAETPLSVDPSASPVVQPADPRLGKVVAELKEILRILKADPA
jgi:DNA-binding transcriptional MerR regulator